MKLKMTNDKAHIDKTSSNVKAQMLRERSQNPEENILYPDSWLLNSVFLI